MEIYYQRIPEKCDISGRCGVYIITHVVGNSVEKYVGSSKDIHQRVYKHPYNVLYVDTLITNDIMLAESLERILIYILKPASNIKKYELTDNDKELKDELVNQGLIDKLADKEIKIGYRYLKYVIMEDKQMEKELIRKIFRNGELKQASLPDEWGEIGKYIKWEIINEKEIKGTIV